MTSGNDSAGSPLSNPWQERKDRGRLPALAACLRLLATSPRRFFESIRPDAGAWGPLLFVGLVTVIAAALDGLVLTVLAVTLPEPVVDLLYALEIWSDSYPSEETPFGNALYALIAFQFLLLALPVIFVLTLLFTLVLGGIAHLLLVVTRTPRPHGVRGTWAVVCYANGAGVLTVVPFAGDIASVVWTAVLFALGLRVVQGVGPVKAAILASIVPLLALLSLAARFLMEARAL